MLSPVVCCRLYIVGSNKKDYDGASDFCKQVKVGSNKNFGLAIWNTSELYEDIKYLAILRGKDLYTALNNENGETCHNRQDCSGKLVWRQTKDGPMQYFQATSGFPR